MTSTGAVNRRDIQNDLPINDPINDPISGINSRDGQRVVDAVRRSGAADTTSVRYDSTQVTNELRRAFNGGYRDVVRLLKTWGWKQAAIDQLFPAGESSNFNWNVFFDRIQGVVMAYDQMPADQKTVYCQVRGIADPNRGWANFNEFAPRTSMNQADSTIREVSTIIAETNASIETGAGRPTDSAAALIYDTVLMLRETNSQYVRLGDAGQIRGWAPWLKEAVYLRLATNAGSQYLVARSNGTREVKHQELRTYLLGARRREENRSSENHDVASDNNDQRPIRRRNRDTTTTGTHDTTTDHSSSIDTATNGAFTFNGMYGNTGLFSNPLLTNSYTGVASYDHTTDSTTVHDNRTTNHSNRSTGNRTNAEITNLFSGQGFSDQKINLARPYLRDRSNTVTFIEGSALIKDANGRMLQRISKT